MKTITDKLIPKICRCGIRPMKAKGENNLYRVLCPTWRKGCGSSSQETKIMDDATQKWNAGEVKKR